MGLISRVSSRTYRKEAQSDQIICYHRVKKMLGKIRKSLKSNHNPLFSTESSSKNSKTAQQNSFQPLDPSSPSQNIINSANNDNIFNFKPASTVKYGCLVVLGANGRTPL